MAESDTSDLTQLTVQLLSAYVGNNSVAAEDLAGLIASTRAALSTEPVVAAAEKPAHVAAVGIRKSLASPDHLLSLIDGKPYKLLKRHLAANGLTPDEYRARYNLPKDYPMVAKAYADERRVVAARTGLGGRRSKAAPKSTADTANIVTPAAEPANAPPAVEAPAQDAPAKVEGKKAPVAKPAAAKAVSKKSTATRKAVAKPTPVEPTSVEPASAKPVRATRKAAKPSTSTAESAPSVPVASPAASKAAPAKKKPVRAAAAKPVPQDATVEAIAETPIPSEPVASPKAPAPRKAPKVSKASATPEKPNEESTVQPEKKKARKKLGVRIPDATAD
ncbi:transcriptional regulator, MucR family [Sphingobium sp. AP50]|uniref:MucR family transcriptional regulator n=1 Tax=Sphingobium sp. AP50 TaxID=1884369 RepID=UPI0008C3B96A|nr:MucR family transcriptional regulator [Sphingobium sp. AP50]SEK02138.1 transcriptional regulator, MucR family [Sphingobium sp. AP50]